MSQDQVEKDYVVTAEGPFRIGRSLVRKGDPVRMTPKVAGYYTGKVKPVRKPKSSAKTETEKAE